MYWGDQEPVDMQIEELLQDLDGLLETFFRYAAKITYMNSVDEVITCLQRFNNFEPTYSLPLASKVLPKEKLESHYEDFIAYQVHNDKNLEFYNDLR